MSGISREIKRGITAILSLLIILTCIAPISVHAEEKTEEKVVRVGFFSSPFNIKKENGHLSGYAYDCQQDSASYTGWKY